MKVAITLTLFSACTTLSGLGCHTRRQAAPPVPPPVAPPPPAHDAPRQAAGKQPPPAPAGDLAVRFWEAWLTEAYSAMFDDPLPGCEDLPQYCSGTQGLVAYGNTFRTLAKLAHLAQVPGQYTFIPIDSDEAHRIFQQVAKVPLSRKRSPFTQVAAGAIRWAWQHLVPRPDATIRGHQAREVYRCVFARTARAYATAYVRLSGRPGGLDAEAKLYARQVAQGRDMQSWLDYRYHGKLPAKLLSEQAGNGTCNTAGAIFGFWIRRHLDGTDHLIAGYLLRLLKRYDPHFVSSLGTQARLLK